MKTQTLVPAPCMAITMQVLGLRLISLPKPSPSVTHLSAVLLSLDSRNRHILFSTYAEQWGLSTPLLNEHLKHTHSQRAHGSHITHSEKPDSKAGWLLSTVTEGLLCARYYTGYFFYIRSHLVLFQPCEVGTVTITDLAEKTAKNTARQGTETGFRLQVAQPLPNTSYHPPSCHTARSSLILPSPPLMRSMWLPSCYLSSAPSGCDEGVQAFFAEVTVIPRRTCPQLGGDCRTHTALGQSPCYRERKVWPRTLRGDNAGSGLHSGWDPSTQPSPRHCVAGPGLQTQPLPPAPARVVLLWEGL